MADPRIWGTDLWASMHRISLRYPVRDPTHEQRRAARCFFESLQHLLPCSSCRSHYRKYFAKTFTDKTLRSRYALARWVYDLHEEVNSRLGKPTGTVAFEDLPSLYNRFPLRYLSEDGKRTLREPRFSTLANDFSGAEIDVPLSDSMQKAVAFSDNDKSLLQQPPSDTAVAQGSLMWVVIGLTLLAVIAAVVIVVVRRRKQTAATLAASKRKQIFVAPQVD